jgi:hypothetical protein
MITAAEPIYVVMKILCHFKNGTKRRINFHSTFCSMPITYPFHILVAHDDYYRPTSKLYLTLSEAQAYTAA